MMCIHAWVSGQVQGVYFRDHARRRAQALHLTGWVRNLRDGRVETIACGELAAIEQWIHWLHQGSPKAKVSAVEWQEITPQHFPDFSITTEE